jgi:hypothetical protein
MAPPGCFGTLERAEEQIPVKDMAGTWEVADSDCTQTITEPCLCSCACYFYKGCPFSGTPIWSCGKNIMIGPCIQISFVDKNKIQQTWLGAPADEMTRAKVMERA